MAVADALLSWFKRHPGYSDARAVLVELLGAMTAPLGPDIRVPDDLLEVRDMLATRAERWKQDWREEGRREGEQIGRRDGEALLLLRQLERRFGPLSGEVRNRVLAAETDMLEQWAMRILDANSLAEVLS